MNDEIKKLKDEEQDDELQSIESDSGNKIVALVLIAVGVVLIAGNIFGFSFDNWWALFMFIPVFSLFNRVWEDYQENGRITNEGVGPLIGGLAVLTITAIFLFNLDWGKFWPLAFIFGGISVWFGGRK